MLILFVNLAERDAFDTLFDHAPDKLNVVKKVRTSAYSPVFPDTGKILPWHILLDMLFQGRQVAQQLFHGTMYHWAWVRFPV